MGDVHPCIGKKGMIGVFIMLIFQENFGSVPLFGIDFALEEYCGQLSKQVVSKRMEPFQVPLCFIGWLPKLALFVYLSHPSFWSINSLPNQRIDVLSDI